MRSLEDASKNGRTMAAFGGSGQPRATADREDRLIVSLAATAPDSSLSTIRRATRTLLSTMTIHRRLRE
ncbi:hypothetical protein TNCV_3601901 [Trichonephila clavipes]|nr:hypothetical protein TNCV_3601901 [Trichonephila clavipes]